SGRTRPGDDPESAERAEQAELRAEGPSRELPGGALPGAHHRAAPVRPDEHGRGAEAGAAADRLLRRRTDSRNGSPLARWIQGAADQRQPRVRGAQTGLTPGQRPWLI